LWLVADERWLEEVQGHGDAGRRARRVNDEVDGPSTQSGDAKLLAQLLGRARGVVVRVLALVLRDLT